MSTIPLDPRLAEAVSGCVPDWLPSRVNAGRAFVTIGAVELLWIVTGWPNGASALACILLIPKMVRQQSETSEP